VPETIRLCPEPNTRKCWPKKVFSADDHSTCCPVENTVTNFNLPGHSAAGTVFVTAPTDVSLFDFVWQFDFFSLNNFFTDIITFVGER